MPRKFLRYAALIAFIFLLPATLSAHSSDQDKLTKEVRKIGVKGDITVVRSDGQWFYGSVERIDDTSFTIYEIEQKQTINFS